MPDASPVSPEGASVGGSREVHGRRHEHVPCRAQQVPAPNTTNSSERREPSRRTDSLEEGSILKLRFPDHSFDGVMLNQVLHHLDAASDYQQLRQCLGEVLRVLKPTGALCINTCSQEQLTPHGPIWYYHVFPEATAFIAPRYIPVHQLCSILEGAGLVGVSVESQPEECFFAKEQYDNVEGPFREEWRQGDSAFAVYRDTPDILAIRLQELRKSIKDRSIDDILAQSERLRERLGQYVVIVARKP